MQTKINKHVNTKTFVIAKFFWEKCIVPILFTMTVAINVHIDKTPVLYHKCTIQPIHSIVQNLAKSLVTWAAVCKPLEEKAPDPIPLSAGPCAPLYVAVDLQCVNSTAMLSWEKRDEVDLYVANARKSNGEYAASCNSISSTCLFLDLDCGETYTFTVTAYSNQCESEVSNTVEMTTGMYCFVKYTECVCVCACVFPFLSRPLVILTLSLILSSKLSHFNSLEKCTINHYSYNQKATLPSAVTKWDRHFFALVVNCELLAQFTVMGMNW